MIGDIEKISPIGVNSRSDTAIFFKISGCPPVAIRCLLVQRGTKNISELRVQRALNHQDEL